MSDEQEKSLPILPSTAADLRRAGVTVALAGVVLLVIGWRFWVGRDLGDPAGGIMLWIVGGALLSLGSVTAATAKRRGAPEADATGAPPADRDTTRSA